LEALLGRVAATGENPPADPDAEGRPAGPARTASRSTSLHGPHAFGLPPGEEPSPPPEPAAPQQAPPPHELNQAQAAGSPGCAGLPRVEIARIDSNPFQPRQDFDPEEIRTLADSLHVHGLLQPVVVRVCGDRYQLIAGERRLRAASKAGWTDVPVQVVEADDREAAELAIVENLQRKDLGPLEKAASFQRYLEHYGSTQEELAARLKLDRSTIANLIRLLELPEPVREAVRRAKITQGHARALLPLGEEREQIAFCRRIQDEALSVRATEELVQAAIREADGEPLGLVDRDGTRRPRRPQSEHLASLEQEFRLALGTKVKITHSARGRGKLVIHFTSHEEFERLRRHLCGPDAPEAHSHAG
jgi:ParB family chromosome partitioning protein